MEENLKRVEEIKIIRSLKQDLNNPRYKLLKRVEKATILKALNDYEHSLISLITMHNKNAKMLQDEGIETKEVQVPKEEVRTPSYDFADSLLLATNENKSTYLKDTTRMILSGDPIHHNLTEQEFIVLAKALKDYATNLQNAIAKEENNQKLYEEDGIKPSAKPYQPLSQQDALNTLYNNVETTKKMS